MHFLDVIYTIKYMLFQKSEWLLKTIFYVFTRKRLHNLIKFCMNSYKTVQYLFSEAEYAYSQKKEIVPLRMQKGYAATGWLGAMIGAKLFYDFSGKYDFDKKFQELYLALSGKTSGGSPQKTLSTISEVCDIVYFFNAVWNGWLFAEYRIYASQW